MFMRLSLSTSEHDEALDVTNAINQALKQNNCDQGFCHILVPHTTAAITVNEGYDSGIMLDVISTLDRLIPWQHNYVHMEDNSAAHIKSILVGAQITIAVNYGMLSLGQWQSVFFLEFDGPRNREIHLTFSSSLEDIH